MFETHVDRLKAMSLMHKNLYTNHSYEEVDIQEYLEEIGQSLQTYTEYNIRTDIDPIIIDMRIAMNIGLIFNEAVTNAIEHAFDGEEGNIDISFKQLGDRYRLLIQDDGKGFDTSQSYKSLGLTLIKDLSVTLAHSTIDIDGEKGTKIQIYFDKEEHA
jgi:two-component sensor histidine kinase